EHGCESMERRARDHAIEDAPHDRTGDRVEHEPGLGGIGPAIAIRWAPARQVLTVLDFRHLPSPGPLLDLLVLDLRRVAAHEPNELALGAGVQGLGDKLDRYARVVGLRE